MAPRGWRWIQTTLALFDDVRVTVDVGPVVDGETAVLRWLFRGTCWGGIPTAAPGALAKQIAFNGVDILRVAGDQVVEYWVSSDGLYLLQHLGVIPASPDADTDDALFHNRIRANHPLC